MPSRSLRFMETSPSKAKSSPSRASHVAIARRRYGCFAERQAPGGLFVVGGWASIRNAARCVFRALFSTAILRIPALELPRKWGSLRPFRPAHSSHWGFSPDIAGGKDSKRLEYHKKRTVYTVCRVKWKKKQDINEAIERMSYDELEDLVRRCVSALIKSQRILKSSGNVCSVGLIIPPKER